MLKANKEAEGRSRMKAAVESLSFDDVAANLNFDEEEI